MLRRGRAEVWKQWRGSAIAGTRSYGSKGLEYKAKMMKEFFEYHQSLRNPDLITFVGRAKAILSSQWRCQLVTRARAVKRDEKLHASIVQFGFFAKPYVCLTKEDKAHKLDLSVDSNATLFVGHTDPPALMERIKLLGKVPPHVVVTGVMAFAEDTEVNRVKEALASINTAAKEVVDVGGQALGPIFEASEKLLASQFESRTKMLDPSSELSIYIFRPRSIAYVDLVGAKHEIELGLAPNLDVLSTLFAGLIEGINQTEERRFTLKVFCMVYRHVKVEDALLYNIDAKGFDIFAKVVKAASSDWMGYRFNFKREVVTALDVCRQMVEMEQECWEAMRMSPAMAVAVTRAAEAEAAVAMAEAAAEAAAAAEEAAEPPEIGAADAETEAETQSEDEKDEQTGAAESAPEEVDEQITATK